MDHRRTFIAGNFCRQFQIDFGISGDNTNEQAVFISAQYQCFKYLGDIFSQLFRHMGGCQIIFVYFIRDEFISHLGFIKQTRRTGVLESRRGSQTMEWVKSMTDDYIRTMIYSNPRVQKCMDELSGQVMSGEMPPTLAAKELIDTIEAALKA